MFKNSEVKRLVFFQSLILLGAVLIVVFFSNFTFHIYKKELIKNNAYIISNIIEVYPELEDNVISSILNQTGDYHKGLEILKTYGLDDVDSLEYLNFTHELKQNIIALNITFSLVICILVSILYFLFVRKQYQKIERIDTYMNNILNNDYSMDIREYCEGDISNLKNDVYKMTTRLKEQNDQSLKDKKYLEETLSDISHQLRTPLTSMYVINDILGNKNLPLKDKKEFLTKNRSQLERIEWLVTSLLKMSRIDSGTVVLKRKKEKVLDLVSKGLEPLRIPLEIKGICLEIECDSAIIAEFDMNWTVEAFVNIVKNACEHTPLGGTVRVVVCQNPIFTEICITDSGEGISKEDLPHVFERFYKGKHNKESIGIGLNMARKIITMQEGDISVTSEILKGTTFSIKLYKNVV